MKKTMKRKSVLMMALTILLILAVSGCSKPLFNVTENEDNTISMTAEKAAAGSAGVSYITAGENEILVAEMDFGEKGKSSSGFLKQHLEKKTFLMNRIRPGSSVAPDRRKFPSNRESTRLL